MQLLRIVFCLFSLAPGPTSVEVGKSNLEILFNLLLLLFDKLVHVTQILVQCGQSNLCSTMFMCQVTLHVFLHRRGSTVPYIFHSLDKVPRPSQLQHSEPLLNLQHTRNDKFVSLFGAKRPIKSLNFGGHLVKSF